MTTKQKETTTITGEISNIRFQNSEGWSVFSLQGISHKFTGILPQMVEAGTTVTCTGIFESNQYGKQLKCESIVPEAPDTNSEAGVLKLLQRLPGIGPKKAMEAVQKHGHEKAWEFAIEDPTQIGVPASKKEAAIAVATSMLDTYDTTVYLLGIGLTDNQAAKIYSTFKKDTKKIVSEEPYRLIDIEGFGFLTVDKIALKAGISISNPSRIAACIMYVINESSLNGGHVYHSGWALSDIVLDTLTQSALSAEVPMIGAPVTEDIRKQVYFLESEGKVEIRKGKVFGKGLLKAEQSILQFLEV